jgi:simple sugar transport system ATP-binding protein
MLGEAGTASFDSTSGRLINTFTKKKEEPRKRVEELMETYGLQVDLDARVWDLEVGARQRVELLKTLYLDIDLLVLDEPTAVLTPQESEQLFETLQSLVEEGLSIIFITHKLEEVTRVTDRATVLRDGKVVDTVETASVTENDIARLMVGKDVLLESEREPREGGDTLMAVRGLRAEDYRGIERVRGVDLDIHEKEIIGVAGVSGNGQKELAECLVGMRKPIGGTITIDDEDYTGRPPRAFIDAGVSFIPEDRYRYGCAPGRTVGENLLMKDLSSFSTGVFVDKEKMREHAEKIVEQFDIKTPSIDIPASKLSGGNLQKMIVGRELDRNPRVLIANQPTRGLDVGSIEYVREVIMEQSEGGTGVLLISEDLNEVMDLSDRIIVMYEGEIVHETPAESADFETIGRYMTQGKQAEEAEDSAREGVV